jgi:hypothetical protein
LPLILWGVAAAAVLVGFVVLVRTADGVKAPIHEMRVELPHAFEK